MVFDMEQEANSEMWMKTIVIDNYVDVILVQNVEQSDYTMYGIEKPISASSSSIPVPAATPVPNIPAAPLASTIPLPGVPQSAESSIEIIQGDEILKK